MRKNLNRMFNPFLIIFCIWFLLMGCAANKIQIKIQEKVPAKSEEFFTAGAAKVDITPPPGYPMGGFSIAGKFSRGWWTRLYAKSIYLQDRQGNRLVLVSADLWAFPAGLADKICQVIAENEPALRLGREEIVFAATHTHHSPGNYSSSSAYNLLGSPGSGFNRSLFDKLVDQISDVIIESFKHRRKAMVSFKQIQLPGLSRNRSYEAFTRNPEKNSLMMPSCLVSDSVTPGLPAFVNSVEHLQAVDPTLSVLDIVSLDTSVRDTLAVAAFFAVHPTAMGTKTEVYSGDIFAVAASHVKKTFSNDKTIVALFNGAFGDICANWKRQDRYNTLQLGKRLGGGIWEAQQNADMKLEGTISNVFKYVTIKDKSVEADFVEPGDTFCQPNPVLRTAKKSIPGVSALGGAENGRTIFFDFGFREGVIDEKCNGRQGAKKFTGKQVFEEFLHIDTGEPINKMLLQWIKNILSGQGPDKIPLGLHRFGSVTFATLPGEFTFTLGQRIKDHLKKELSETAKIILIGPANEYLSYFTTPSEFNAQHYEGAMTLCGQFSGTYVKQELAKLARLLPTGESSYDLEYDYNVGALVHPEFGRIKEGDHWNMEEALKNILQDHRTGAVHVRFPQVTWTDKVIHLSEVMDSANRPVNPVVSVERQQAENHYSLVESDTNSVNFVCLIHAVTGNTAHWCAIWMTSSEDDSTQAMRFKIGLPSGGTLYSADFRLEDYASDKPIPLPIAVKKP